MECRNDEGKCIHIPDMSVVHFILYMSGIYFESKRLNKEVYHCVPQLFDVV